MPIVTASEIIDLFLVPSSLSSRSESFWSEAVPRLRQSGLLGRLACETGGHWEGLPPAVRDQFEAALVVSGHQRAVMDNELRLLGNILSLDAPVVLLKGAAYQALGTPNARGRVSCDIDLMVPKGVIADAERLLKRAGWAPVETTKYDEHYFREWMHELPPFRHPERGTLIDLHHSITPPVSRSNVDPEMLFAAARPIPNSPFLALCPEDMVLHSARHLLGDGEYQHGLRDFFDMYELLAHFSQIEPDFWNRLRIRAEQLHLQAYLYHVVLVLRRCFRLQVPHCALHRIERGRSRHFDRVVNALIELSMFHGSERSVAERVAALFFWMGAHYVRMPLRLLVPHLARKSVVRLQAAVARSPGDQDP